MNKFFSSLTLALLTLSFSSCLKENYDAPPTGGKDPNIEVNMTIEALKAMYNGTAFQITDDFVIKGLVVADDKSGNFYKTIVIEDSTAGISVRLDNTSLYTDYPIGRRIFIKCKGLWVGAYANLIQLGGSINTDGNLDAIPSTLFDKHILKGVYGLPVIPHPVSIAQLNNTYQNKLIELNDVEFNLSDAGKPYADAANKQSLNRTIKDCSGKTIIVRTSGYASFASQLTPSGNGKLLAVYTVYNSTAQLVLRSPADLKMDTTRCGGGVVVSGNGIMGIRTLWAGSDVTIPSGKTITGIVISDKDNANTDPKNLIIQDSTGGIVVRFTANHTYALGDEVTVDVSGQQLTSYNGLIEVNNVPSSAASKTGTGTVTPRVATIAQVQANADAWESTLITIQNATITGTGSTYSGTKTLNDGTGTLSHYTRSQATFSATALPSGNKSFTGVLGDFNGPQLAIRSLSDVQ
ncbi:MAG: hypothetical protein KIS94_05330 [Chitinophagales bacterium]|nr:hypothetical protein [Chitinophagales bacterium]